MFYKAVNIELENSQTKKILFLVRLCKMINRQSILANVDESVFSRSTDTNYSWSRKGEHSNLSTTVLVYQSA